MTTTHDIIKQFVNANTDIESITIVQFAGNSIIQDRFSDLTPINSALDQALTIRNNYQLPFWDALLTSQLNSALYSSTILKEAIYHNKNISQITLDRQDISDIDGFAFSKDSNFGINSKLSDNNNQTRHLILLDFHIFNKPKNVACVEEVIKLLKLSGYLMGTNKSYHFIGDKLVTEEELKQLLYHALLFSPIIDKNWIAHQLIEGSCTLRITMKDSQTPYMIKYIK